MDEKRKNPIPWLIIGGGLILLLAAVTFVVINRPAPAAQTPTPGSVEQVQRVTLEDAKAAYDNGSAIFVDVRDSGSYAGAHIPGAVNIPNAELPNRSGELNPKAWIIPY
jgi:3-mercaptopyruvate sulfurtransferase SseA